MNKLIAATDSLKEVICYYVILIIFSTIAFSYLEGKDMFASLYWAVITSTSTGYGDISPATTGGRFLAMFVTLGSVFFIGPMIVGHIIGNLMKDEHKFTHEEQEFIIETLKELKGK